MGETIYVIVATNEYTMERLTIKAYRNGEEAIKDRDEMNKRWVGKFRHTIDIIELY